jgi:hypothetical protein
LSKAKVLRKCGFITQPWKDYHIPVCHLSPEEKYQKAKSTLERVSALNIPLALKLKDTCEHWQQQFSHPEDLKCKKIKFYGREKPEKPFQILTIKEKYEMINDPLMKQKQLRKAGALVKKTQSYYSNY